MMEWTKIGLILLNGEFNKQASCGLWDSASLKMSIHIHFLQESIFTGKVGHTDLFVGVQSGFISRSVHARLQISVYSGYDLYHPGQNPDTHMWTAFNQLIWKAQPAEQKRVIFLRELYSNTCVTFDRSLSLIRSRILTRWMSCCHCVWSRHWLKPSPMAKTPAAQLQHQSDSCVASSDDWTGFIVCVVCFWGVWWCSQCACTCS